MKSQKKGQYKKCLICGKEFYAYRYRILEGNSKYCSRKCWSKSRLGHIPWNRGTKGIMKSNKTSWKRGIIPKGSILFKKGDTSWNKGKQVPQIQNENHPLWKGDKASQKAIHSWIKRKYGKAKVCEICGSNKNIGWANKYHTYKRKIEDWMQVCLSCHRKYDIENNNYKGGIIGYNEKTIF